MDVRDGDVAGKVVTTGKNLPWTASGPDCSEMWFMIRAVRSTLRILHRMYSSEHACPLESGTRWRALECLEWRFPATQTTIKPQAWYSALLVTPLTPGPAWKDSVIVFTAILSVCSRVHAVALLRCSHLMVRRTGFVFDCICECVATRCGARIGVLRQLAQHCMVQIGTLPG